MAFGESLKRKDWKYEIYVLEQKKRLQVSLQALVLLIFYIY